jgi:hypothetical protein
MSRPVFDTAALWATLTPDQQRAIGVAAIDREIVIHGRDEIEGPEVGDFSPFDHQAEDEVIAAVTAVLDLEAIDADLFPLPSFSAGATSNI